VTFFRGIAEKPLCGLVPAGYDPVQVFADDGIFRRLDNGCQSPAGLFGLL
jgi:hypothetical protein